MLREGHRGGGEEGRRLRRHCCEGGGRDGEGWERLGEGVGKELCWCLVVVEEAGAVWEVGIRGQLASSRSCSRRRGERG